MLGSGGIEQERLREADEGVPWRRWGPYLSERSWGTVREDYSPGGDAWDAFPHDHARSRAYRWSEDGLAGISDDQQLLCFALALWNGRDPFLKERIFGLTNAQGNHGEDPKEYWWYLDSTPTHSWMRWRYVYPQAAFPYDDLVEGNARRLRTEPEYELLDTGVFDDDRYWEVTVDYAKADVEDLLVRVTVRNAGPDEATLEVLPTLWFRNTWSWMPGAPRPELRAGIDGRSIVAAHDVLGTYHLHVDGDPDLLFCENESNASRLWHAEESPAFPKDGINDHVVHGAGTVNPDRRGTKAAARYSLTVPAGGTAEVRLRLATSARPVDGGFDATMATRENDADEFYDALTPDGADGDEAEVMRQAFGGMLWTKQYFHYDVDSWLEGDEAGPPPPAERRHGRNAHWRHIANHDIVSMPDKWEYPWYAVWDSAFHCVPLAHVDMRFAKDQLLLFLSERYQHPNGQIPAYEWNFGDVNPPVHAWAVLKVFELDGRRDLTFLARCFHKLLLNFTWWVNKKDRDGNNVFEGGFLGLDNIGPIDRSASHDGVHLEQSDGTAWVAMFSLNLLKMALRLSEHDVAYEDIASKFFEHFCRIAAGINDDGRDPPMWNEDDGFYYDVLHREGEASVPLRVRSMVGLMALYAVEVLSDTDLSHLDGFEERTRWFLGRQRSTTVDHLEIVGEGNRRLLSIVGPERLRRILAYLGDPEEFLSPYGVRALSRRHLEHPVRVDLGGGATAEVGYEPAESSSPMFGGNSNWRGPVWFPVNYLLIESLREFHEYLGDDFTVEYPHGSGHQATLAGIADDLSRRLVAIFLRGEDGRRPVFGGTERFQTDPAWRDNLLFYEYFHGDDGAGIGAPHQTGWTGIVADLVASGRGLRRR